MNSLFFNIFYFIISVYIKFALTESIDNDDEIINNWDAQYQYGNNLSEEQDKSLLLHLKNEDNLEDFDYFEAITKCAVGIIDAYTENEFLWIETEQERYKNAILQSTNRPYKVFSNYTHKLDAVEFGVVALDSADLDATMLTKLQRLAILVIYQGEDTLKLLENLWRLSYLKVAVITRDLRIVGYPDFALKDCERVIHTREFGECGEHVPGGLYRFAVLKDYEGCRVRFYSTIVVPYVIDPYDPVNPGYEVLTVLDIARSLNFTADFVRNNFTDWGYEKYEGGYTNMYAALYERKVDFVFGMVLANESYCKDFIHTHPHTVGHIAFYLPAASLLEPWKNLVLIFDPVLWYSVLATIIFVVVTWWIFGTVLEEEYAQLSYAFTQVWSVYLFVSVNKPSTRLMKILFMLWIFFSFIVNSIYQGVLISFLTKPTYEHQIDTIEEMVAADFPRGGYHTLANLFKRKESATDWDIYTKYIKCDLSITCMNRTAFKRDMATFKNLKQIRYEIPKYYLDENGRCKLHEFKPSIFYNIWMTTYKGHHLRDSVNKVVFRMLQNGLILKYVMDLQKKPVEVSHVDVEPLTIKHLQAAFYLVAMGLGLSIIVFVAEMSSTSMRGIFGFGRKIGTL